VEHPGVEWTTLPPVINLFTTLATFLQHHWSYQVFPNLSPSLTLYPSHNPSPYATRPENELRIVSSRDWPPGSEEGGKKKEEKRVKKERKGRKQLA